MSDVTLVPEGQPIVLQGSLEPASSLYESVECPVCDVRVFIGPKQQSILRRYARTNPVTVLCPTCSSVRSSQDPLSTQAKADGVL